MSKASLTFLGGAGTVTGSRHLLQLGGRKVLVDCGLFQGLKALRLKNWAEFPVDPSSIDAVVLTHAHLDHSGYLPKLVREGFRGPIFCTAASADLCELLLLDSAKIQESDAEFANRHGFSKHKPALPLYGRRDALRALEQLRPIDFDTPTDLGHGANLYFRRAGHILGAATAHLRWGGQTFAFSGDLGRFDDPLMHDPAPVAQADYLVVESTYGDRIHAPIAPADALLEVIQRTTARGGTVIIPSFAVGRAQELLYLCWRLKQSGRLPLTPIYLDSPMAINASGMLERHPLDHRLSADECDAAMASATYVQDVEESKALSHNTVPKVIISASGMATGGRVLHHIKAYGPDAKNTILFAGFQAAGTRGEALMNGAREVKIHGGLVPIRAEIDNLPMLSAHADANEILRWLCGFQRPPKKTFIVHGEGSASAALKERIEAELGWSCVIPAEGDEQVLT
ncbi:MBL fold metallo-hydrolase RNA specificity domain-containing protein [Caulobacter vibrioides]|jgi:metallo-beta-lactamase family protein|uniref:MBL fold metallo-hydrolase RNA specificity domain-containing protein n=1 Tax=Caulobacter vibrioides TaxID=155892 RepID=UPI000BB46BE2|nr:MBL fold metallo-hydrolase [Caulobacter vibrioides]ATC28493.1 MBL fold metallo-hydrolase [Caulobacter vibrioides]